MAELTDLQNELIERHLALVIEANKAVNLTRIDSVEDGRLLHAEDSLAGLPEVEKAPEGLMGDMGSGAGYPGIPLAVATGRETMLIESVGKKAACLRNFAEELGLQDRISVYSGRLEELCETKRGGFAVLTARALAQVSILMELASPLLKTGGQLVCYKAVPSEEEVSHAMKLQDTLGMKFVSRRDFLLSDGCTSRCILVFEKVGKPKIKLPRHVGFAQKKPL